MAALGVAALLTASLAACTDDAEEPAPAPAPTAEAAVPEYDVRNEAAAAVLPLVPASATSLSVTDLGRIRLQFGLTDLDGQAAAAERAAFWTRAERQAPLLADGLLRPVDQRLSGEYGFTQDDVVWEARFRGPDGPGWVLSFRLGVDLAAVRRAVRDGVGRLAGAEVRAEDNLVSVGAAPDGAQSWAATHELTALVGPPAEATYVERGCVQPPPGVDTSRVDELTAWSVALHGDLATARLGDARADAFLRMRLGERWPVGDPAFSDGFRNGVADPSSGRVGYQLVDPPVAADLVRSRTLPFAACAE